MEVTAVDRYVTGQFAEEGDAEPEGQDEPDDDDNATDDDEQLAEIRHALMLTALRNIPSPACWEAWVLLEPDPADRLLDLRLLHAGDRHTIDHR
jgi:hypothetical protein